MSTRGYVFAGLAALVVAVIAWPSGTARTPAPAARGESQPDESAVTAASYRDVDAWVGHLEEGKPVRFVRDRKEVPASHDDIPTDSEYDVRPLGTLSEQELTIPRSHLRGLAKDARQRLERLLDDDFDPSDPESVRNWGRYVLEAESCDAALRQLEAGRYYVLKDSPRQMAPEMTFYTLPCLKDGKQVVIHFALRHDEHAGVAHASAFADHQAKAALETVCLQFNELGYARRQELVAQRDRIFRQSSNAAADMAFLSEQFPLGVKVDPQRLVMFQP